MQNKLNFLDDVLKSAKKSGADKVDVALSESRNTVVKCRNGALENTGRSESISMSLRVFVGRRVASMTCSNFDQSSVNALIDQAIAIAKLAPESPYADIVGPDALATDTGQDLELWDNTPLDSAALFETAKTLEEAALSVKGVEQCRGAMAGAGDSSFGLLTSNGFSGLIRQTGFARSCSAVAADENGKEVGFDMSFAAFVSDLSDAYEIGKMAGERAAGKLGGRKIKTGQFPVVFAPRQSNAFVNVFAGLISGPAVASGMTFLKDNLGERIFSDGIHIIDDPHIKRAQGSRNFDGEGVATRKTNLIDNGALTQWMLDSSSAKQLGMEVTGHARPLGNGVGPSNLYMAAGSLPADKLIEDIKFGFYVTDVMGRGANRLTGTFSQGAAGFLIENGKITTPVKEATIAGTLKDMFLEMTPAGDLTFKYKTNAPTLRIDCLTVSGV